MGLRDRKRRRLRLVLLIFAASFFLALSGIVAVRHFAAGHGPAIVESGRGGYLAPANLDAQWVTYSDESTCADRAGGDGVSAVRIGSSQIAWFFSDSSLGPASPRTGFSRQSGFVHNLVVMQTVRGNASRLVTITGGSACAGPGKRGRARSVVNPGIAGGPEKQRYWTGDGLRYGSRILHFYSRYLPGALVPTGTVIAAFDVSQLASAGQGPPYGEVITPAITKLPSYVPPGGGTPIVWGTSLLRLGSTVYVYGWQNPGSGPSTDRAYLARVAVSRLTDFGAWRFSAGDGHWEQGQSSAQPLPVPVGLTIDTVFSVIRANGRYWLIEQTGGLGGATIDAYPARAPSGPFDQAAAVGLYRAPGIGLTSADHFDVIYDAMAVPTLSSPRTLLISYDENTLAVTAGCLSLSAFTNAVVQPRFISVPMTAFHAGAGQAPAVAAVAGPTSDPFAASKHQPQWFDSWSYRGGCPPLRPVGGITVSNGRVAWRPSGPGVRYQVYLSQAGGKSALVRTTGKTSVALHGLTAGRRYRVVIVPENVRHGKGPAAGISFTASGGGALLS